MSREYPRKTFYVRERDRDRDWGRNDYRYEKRRSRSRKRSRSPPRDHDKRRSRTPRKIDKDLLDENILSEISKLPEPSELWDNQTQDAGYTGPPPPPFPQEVWFLFVVVFQFTINSYDLNIMKHNFEMCVYL